jgi:DUF4097 and DUF4098 domain-containing protein YvlB
MSSARHCLATRTSALLVGALSAFSVGCDHRRVEETTTEELRFDTNEQVIVEIRVDDGDVNVTGGSVGGVEVVFTKRARASDTTRARSLLQSAPGEVTQDGDIIRIFARSNGSSAVRFGSRVTTDVTVRLPAAAHQLDIRTEDGSIDIVGVSGTIVAETDDGSIRVDTVDGNLRLRTADGSITGKTLTGDVDVVSDDGRIRLDGDFGQLRAVTADGSIRVSCGAATTISKDWSLRTSDGSIELNLPTTANARLDATAIDGRVSNRLSRFKGSEREHSIKGIIGDGGDSVFSILLATMDGRIVLKDS